MTDKERSNSSEQSNSSFSTTSRRGAALGGRRPERHSQRRHRVRRHPTVLQPQLITTRVDPRREQVEQVRVTHQRHASFGPAPNRAEHPRRPRLGGVLRLDVPVRGEVPSARFRGVHRGIRLRVHVPPDPVPHAHPLHLPLELVILHRVLQRAGAGRSRPDSRAGSHGLARR